LDHLTKFTDPKLPVMQRQMAAKGLLPLTVEDKCLVWSLLLSDPEKDVAREAAKQMLRLDQEIIVTALPKLVNTLPKILPLFWGKGDFLKSAITHIEDENSLKSLAQHPNTELASSLAQNERILNLYPSVALTLLKRSDIPEEFLDRLKVIGDSLELKPEEEPEVIAFKDSTAVDLRNFIEDFSDHEIDDILSPFLIEGSVNIDDLSLDDSEEKQNIMKTLGNLSIPQKIKLALKGNSFIRKTFIRSPVKTVSLAVLENDRIKLDEVVNYAGNKSISVEVLTKIANSKKFKKNYSVRLALIKNPKTPIRISLSFLKTITKSDLKVIAKNRNIASFVSKEANKLEKRK